MSRALMVGLLAGAVLAMSLQTAEHRPAEEAQLAALTNQERMRRGIDPLVESGALTKLARQQALSMAKDGTIYHNPKLKSQAPPGYCKLGENVGMASTVVGVHDAFMSSPGHRDNILDRDYNKFGVGVYSDGDTLYAAVVFGCYRSTAPKPEPKPAPKETCT